MRGQVGGAFEDPAKIAGVAVPAQGGDLRHALCAQEQELRACLLDPPLVDRLPDGRSPLLVVGPLQVVRVVPQLPRDVRSPDRLVVVRGDKSVHAGGDAFQAGSADGHHRLFMHRAGELAQGEHEDVVQDQARDLLLTRLLDVHVQEVGETSRRRHASALGDRELPPRACAGGAAEPHHVELGLGPESKPDVTADARLQDTGLIRGKLEAPVPRHGGQGAAHAEEEAQGPTAGDLPPASALGNHLLGLDWLEGT